MTATMTPCSSCETRTVGTCVCFRPTQLPTELRTDASLRGDKLLEHLLAHRHAQGLFAELLHGGGGGVPKDS